MVFDKLTHLHINLCVFKVRRLRITTNKKTMLYEIQTKDWQETYSEDIQAKAIQAFESGKILLLPQLSFQFLPHEKIFFSTEFSDPKFKNISYNPIKDCLRGTK